ncbi:MAG: cbb3-type cytochrome c oxidase subunit I [Planctomycetota bacterium]
MTSITVPGSTAIERPEHGRGEDYLNCDKGWRSWLLTLDHKRIGVMYMIAITFNFFLGGIMALLVRAELWTHAPGPITTDGVIYNNLFTLHGAIMVFLVIIPSIPAVLGNFVLPIMLGAKDVAFPRVNLMSFHLYMVGTIMLVMAILTGGLDTGWTFYTPYSSVLSSSSVVMAVMGAFILGFSSIFTGLNFIVTIHKMRPKGMGYFRMPLFLWSIYATALIQILATPVLGITLLLLTVERALGFGIFDPKLGGDPVLFQHFFWFYSHPAVYIMILPGMGVISELISTFSRRHIFGYRFIAYSSIMIAVFGFLVWGHHMFTSGQSELVTAIFSALTFSVSIPSAIKVFNWVATLYKGSISLASPMLYALSFLFLFGIGGLTGLFLGALATDMHLHDTYFVVAHFHYVMMGSALVAFIGGIHYWWPKMFGRMFNDRIARLCAIGVFVGFNLTFFPQFLAGTQGMPRRYHEYKPEFEGYMRWSTIGAFVLGISLFVAFYNLFSTLRKEKDAPDNPWGGATLEWTVSSPPPHHNFDSEPTIYDPYALDAVVWNPETRSFEHKKDAGLLEESGEGAEHA